MKIVNKMGDTNFTRMYENHHNLKTNFELVTMWVMKHNKIKICTELLPPSKLGWSHLNGGKKV